MLNMISPSEAEKIIIEGSSDIISSINEFTKEVFHTRGGRIGSGMGLLLEGLWGYYLNKHLKERTDLGSIIEIAWITHHEYNDFACVYRSQVWSGDTREGEVLRIEAKSMIASADESKAHFDEVESYFGKNDLLVVLIWDWLPLDEFSYYPKILDQFIGRAVDIAKLRDVLHIQRGGSFVNGANCPDKCAQNPCQHHGEPLNAKGNRERLTGPESRKPANVSYSANFGGLVRMLKTGNESARRVFRQIRKESDSAHLFISFIHKNQPNEEVNQYLKSEWMTLAKIVGANISGIKKSHDIRDAIKLICPNYHEHLRELN
jgi:hypothetical protein